MRKIFLATLLILFLIPGLTRAICEGPLVPCGRDLNDNGKIDPEEQCQFCHLFVLFNNVVDYLLTCLAPIIAVLMLVIGGFYFLIAGPSPARVGRAKSIVTTAIIGITIIMISWVFINTFFTYIGIAKWTGLGTWWEIDCSGGGGVPSTCAGFGGFCSGVGECRLNNGSCHVFSPLGCEPFPCCCIVHH